MIGYITKNLHYTGNSASPCMKIQVKFIVNEDGSLSNIRVVEGLEIKNEIEKLLRQMPKWEPGRKNGKPVKVWFVLPINIHLE